MVIKFFGIKFYVFFLHAGLLQTNLSDTRSSETIILPGAITTSQPEASGGLWAIKDFPQVSSDELQSLSGASYQNLAYNILSRFNFGIPADELRTVINEAYGEQWHRDEITPVKQMGNTNLHSLHLGYGPTFAFKNVALEFLPRVLTKILASTTKGVIVNVLGASSGDTVNAAHSGVKETPNIRSTFMLPNTGPSQVQRLQATNGITANRNALTILTGVPFDPLQDIVKRMNRPEFSDFKAEHNIISFNSINIARILAQVVYYFRAYTELLKNGNLQNGDEVIFSVPSGNFGDALAGYYAKKMGLPIAKIHVATNENKMLQRFFETGVYEPDKIVQVTNAPSMDINKSSNFERMLFDICEFDADKIKSFYDTLALTGKFDVGPEVLAKIQEIFISSSSTDTEREDAIKKFGADFDHGIDPHTAAGVVSWLKGEHGLKGNMPVIFLETSHVAQFGPELSEKGILVPGMHEFDDTLNAMRNATPQKGRDFLHTSGDFEETFAAITRAMTEILPKK